MHKGTTPPRLPSVFRPPSWGKPVLRRRTFYPMAGQSPVAYLPGGKPRPAEHRLGQKQNKAGNWGADRKNQSHGKQQFPRVLHTAANAGWSRQRPADTAGRSGPPTRRTGSPFRIRPDSQLEKIPRTNSLAPPHADG